MKHEPKEYGNLEVNSSIFGTFTMHFVKVGREIKILKPAKIRPLGKTKKAPRIGKLR